MIWLEVSEGVTMPYADFMIFYKGRECPQVSVSSVTLKPIHSEYQATSDLVSRAV